MTESMTTAASCTSNAGQKKGGDNPRLWMV
jgi:hypothetical protein